MIPDWIKNKADHAIDPARVGRSLTYLLIGAGKSLHKNRDNLRTTSQVDFGECVRRHRRSLCQESSLRIASS